MNPSPHDVEDALAIAESLDPKVTDFTDRWQAAAWVLAREVRRLREASGENN